MGTGAIDRRRLALGLVRIVGLAVLAVVVISKAPGLDSLRARFAHADAGWIVASTGLEAGSVLAFVLAFHAALARRLTWRQSSALGMSAQGVNVLVPAGGSGGLAAAALIMARAGIPVAFSIVRMVALFLLSGVAPNVLLLVAGGLGVGTGVLPGHASWAASLLPAMIAVALVLAVAYAYRHLPAAVPSAWRGWRRLVRGGLSYVRDGISGSIELLRARDPLLLVGALAFVLLDLGALAGAFHAVSAANLPLGTLMLAYTLGQAGSVISLPGTTEGGLIGVFLLYGAPLVPATSAILVYRAVQTLVPLALGVLGMIELRHLFGDQLPLARPAAPAQPRAAAPAGPER